MQVGILIGKLGHDLLQLAAGDRAVLGIVVAGHLRQQSRAVRIVDAHRGAAVPVAALCLPYLVDVGELEQARPTK